MNIGSIFVTGMPFIILFTFLLAGLVLYLFPPKKINGIYGYRTPRSMKNQANWDYAQKIGGKYMMLFGVVIFITQTSFGFLLSYLGIKQDLTIPFQLAIMILLLILMLVISERKLKQFEYGLPA
jgi:uncharacterized membrane protein